MHIRQMTLDDIPLGMRLKAQNGWNQLEADWRRQLELEPHGAFVAELDGQGVGTACTCVFDDIAWISMVLVDRDQRGKGIGTALMKHVLNHLDERRVTTIRLDATSLGQPVYEKLGFVGDFTLARYDGVMAKDASPVVGVEPMTRDDLAAINALDQSITRTNREKLFRRLVDENLPLMRKHISAGRLDGFCLCRPGANAWQIGPLQGTPDAGRTLLLDAAHRFAGQRVYLDVATANIAAIHLAEGLGLKVQRTFLRMSRGKCVSEDIARLWTAFGPEKG